jgi:hypothetical protein
MGPRVGLDAMEKEKSLDPDGNRTPVVELVAEISQLLQTCHLLTKNMI